MAVCPAGEGSRAPLRVFFVPFFIRSHMLPMEELAYQFAIRGVDCTIMLTDAVAGSHVSPAIEWAARDGIPLRWLHFSFAAGPPNSTQNDAMSNASELCMFLATADARDTVAQIIQEHRPDAVVADFCYPWVNQVAEDLGIPRVFFEVAGAFPCAVVRSLLEHLPHEGLVDGDDSPFLVPNLPDRVEMVMSELPSFVRIGSPHMKTMCEFHKSRQDCFGVVLNTFYELEPTYCDLTIQTSCKRAWFCGPFTLWPREGEQDAAAAAEGHPCISWLDKQAMDSVVFVGFGSFLSFSDKQHREMALGLEASGRPFLWVLRETSLASLPEGFEERVRLSGRGLVSTGWVPQTAILNHPAVGAFLTHLGWNSLNEGLQAGLPLITWPLAFEQFFTERLVVDILRIGVRMWQGCRKNLLRDEVADDESTERGLVKAEDVARVVSRFAPHGSAEDEVEAMRMRAREYGGKMKAALERGGSSYNDLRRLIEELRAFSHGS